MKKILSLFIFTFLTLGLSGCGTLFDKDNTPPPSPLVGFSPEFNVTPRWVTAAGSGAGEEYLKLTPAISGTTIFTADKNGLVSALDKTSGKSLWRVPVSSSISSGIVAYNGAIFFGTSDGNIVALSQTDGKQLWKMPVSSEVLATPSAAQNILLVKTIDGNLSAFSTLNGASLWQYHQAGPALILRGSSSPQIQGDSAIVGFEDGTLGRFYLRNGQLAWKTSIANPQGMFPIQRMADIDADPIIVNRNVYSATYQGQISAIDFYNGQALWSYNLSSYSGIAADANKVYASDARSRILAFNSTNGAITWQQDKLAARNITGPVIFGNYIVVGDEQGYLHWLSKQDGHFVARTRVNSSGILATPLVNNNVLYVYTKNGYLAAYSLG